MANELRVHQNFLGGRLTYAIPASATVITDGVSNSTTTITSATAAFTQADVGATITGTDLPAAVYIASVTNSTTAVLSATATGTGSARTWTINRHLTIHSAAFAAMSVIGTTQHMMASLDEDGLASEPEVIMVTKHDSAATWAQITRAQEGSTARAHVIGTDWVHGPLASDAGRSFAKGFRTAAWTITGSVGTPVTIPFDTEVYDSGAIFNPSTGEFTVPSAGFYHVTSRIAVVSPANTERFLYGVYVGGTEVIRGADLTWITGMGGQIDLQVSGDLQLAASDVVTFRVLQVNGTLRALEVGLQRNCSASVRGGVV